MTTAPRVRAVILNWNGGRHVHDAVAALAATRWPADRLQIVVVDNASTDGSDVEIEKDFGPSGVEVRRTGANLGFPGNNAALADLEGIDFVALVNNDAFVEPGWLEPLVDELEADRGLGAVSPKMLFAPRFCPITLEAPTFTPGRGDDRLLSVQVSGLTVNGVDRWRLAWFGPGCYPPEAGFRWLAGRAEIGVPLWDGAVPPVQVALRLAAPQPVTVGVMVHSAGGGRAPRQVTVGPEPTWVECTVDGATADGATFDVVQNAGSLLLEGGYGADRGFLQPDGPTWDEPAEVWAFCGGAVLFRKAFLQQVGLFWEPYFMYYEDTDLAWRGRAQGWRYTYRPDSVVRHLHGTSAGEGSKLFHHYVERNRLILLTRNAPAAVAAAALGRYLLTIASLARTDLRGALRRRRPPRLVLARQRCRALAAYLRLLPRLLRDRRALRQLQVVPDAVLARWIQPRSSHPL